MTLPGGIDVAPGVRVREEALEFSFSSSSGPGGQNVNKRATKAALRVRLDDLPIHPEARLRLASLGSFYMVGDSEVLITCDEYRSQERNKAGCLERLRELLVHAMKRPKVRRATRPSRGSKERRLAAKRVASERKQRRREPE